MKLYSLSMKNIPVILIIIAATLLWGGQYKYRSLWEPDEARYTYIAREMHDSGNWLIPHRNGETYAHKPPLMFWLINVSTLLTGGEFNGVSGRLPTLLGVVLSLWAVSRLTVMWYDRRTAWYAILILSTSYLFWHKAGTGQIDVLLLGLQLSALYLLFKNETLPSNWRPACAFSLMGLAILAKGPVGLIVPAGIYVSANLLAGNKGRPARPFWLWGIPLSLAWPGTWLFLAWLSGGPPDYFTELLFNQNVGRFAGEFGGHYQPFYYYLKYLAIDFLPWIFLIPAAVRIVINNKHLAGQARILLGWVLFVVIFFSLAGGKRNLYILAVYPALSMLLASTVFSMETLSSRWRHWTIYPIVIIFSLLSVAGLVLLVPPPGLTLPVAVPAYVPLGFSLLTGGGALLLFRFQGRNGLQPRWINILVGVLIVGECYVGTVVFPLFNPLKSPMALAHAVESTLPANRKLILYRLDGEILALYSKRQGIRLDDFNELADLMDKTRYGIVACNQEVWESLQKELEQRNWHVTAHFFVMGSKSLMWFEYGAKG